MFNNQFKRWRISLCLQEVLFLRINRNKILYTTSLLWINDLKGIVLFFYFLFIKIIIKYYFKKIYNLEIKIIEKSKNINY